MCRACNAKDAHIESLEKQLDFFREQLQPRSAYTPTSYTEPDVGDQVHVMEDLPWVSEEEEELLAMRQAGLIDSEGALKDALTRVGAMSTEIEFS